MDEDSNGNSKEVSGRNNRERERAGQRLFAAHITEREGGPDTNFRKEKRKREKRRRLRLHFLSFTSLSFPAPLLFTVYSLL